MPPYDCRGHAVCASTLNANMARNSSDVLEEHDGKLLLQGTVILLQCLHPKVLTPANVSKQHARAGIVLSRESESAY